MTKSSEFDDVFDVNYIVPTITSYRTKGTRVRGSKVTRILTAIMRKINRVEERWTE